MKRFRLHAHYWLQIVTIAAVGLTAAGAGLTCTFHGDTGSMKVDIECPNQIDAGEVEAPAGRTREGILVEGRRLEHPVDVAVAHVADEDRDEMNQWEVKNVKEERHFAVDESGAEKLRSAVVNGAEKKEGGAEGH